MAAADDEVMAAGTGLGAVRIILAIADNQIAETVSRLGAAEAVDQAQADSCDSQLGAVQREGIEYCTLSGSHPDAGGTL